MKIPPLSCKRSDAFLCTGMGRLTGVFFSVFSFEQQFCLQSAAFFCLSQICCSNQSNIRIYDNKYLCICHITRLAVQQLGLITICIKIILFRPVMCLGMCKSSSILDPQALPEYIYIRMCFCWITSAFACLD